MTGPGRHIIIAVHVTGRIEKVPKVQEVFSEYGCYIRTRLGLHDATPEFCSPNGLILIELLDNEEKRASFVQALSKIDGIEVQEMIFDH